MAVDLDGEVDAPVRWRGALVGHGKAPAGGGDGEGAALADGAAEAGRADEPAAGPVGRHAGGGPGGRRLRPLGGHRPRQAEHTRGDGQQGDGTTGGTDPPATRDRRTDRDEPTGLRGGGGGPRQG